MKSKYFRQEDFACRCGCGFDTIDEGLVGILDNLRLSLDAPIIVTSGCRCKYQNKKIGGTEDSAHLKGKAVDIHMRNSQLRYKLIKEAIRLGIVRIGIGRKFIHLDIDIDLPTEVAWVYSEND